MLHMPFTFKIRKLDRVPLICTDDHWGWYKQDAPAPGQRPEINEKVHALYHVPCDCGCVGYYILEEYPLMKWHVSQFKVVSSAAHEPMDVTPLLLAGAPKVTEKEIDAAMKELECWGEQQGIQIRTQRPIIDTSVYTEKLEQLRKFIHFKIDHPEDIHRMPIKQRVTYIQSILKHEDRMDTLRLMAQSFQHFLQLYEMYEQS